MSDVYPAVKAKVQQGLTPAAAKRLVLQTWLNKMLEVVEEDADEIGIGDALSLIPGFSEAGHIVQGLIDTYSGADKVKAYREALGQALTPWRNANTINDGRRATVKSMENGSKFWQRALDEANVINSKFTGQVLSY